MGPCPSLVVSRRTTPQASLHLARLAPPNNGQAEPPVSWALYASPEGRARGSAAAVLKNGTRL
jgi:hypothetical protein